MRALRLAASIRATRGTGYHQGIWSCTRYPQTHKARIHNMAGWGAWQVKTPEFTRLVVDCMRRLYPEELADTKWDNVGLLLDNQSPNDSKIQRKVMVTNDLTYQVAMDAIQQSASVIISYHPIIFSPLKAITNADAQQATLLRLAAAGIAVYSPHTAVDAAPQGLNAWLADVVQGPHAIRSPGVFTDRVPLADILRRLAARLGGLRHVVVASPLGADVSGTEIGSFAVCAGSGYDVVKDADVDLLVLGEASHHSALRAVQQGRTLVHVFHSNSERAYLQQVLRPRLEALLRDVAADAEVIVSEHDRDPFVIVDVEAL